MPNINADYKIIKRILKDLLFPFVTFKVIRYLNQLKLDWFSLMRAYRVNQQF